MTTTDPTNPIPPPARLAWTVWGLGAVLYLYGFFQRVAPGVMGTELSREFALNAAALGNLSAFYFYSYVAMQVPTGLLADRWGPRRLLSLGAAVAALGSLVFAWAPTGALAGLGRLLVGGSVAVAFVGMLKLASHWLPARRYALASGLALFAGLSGAIFAGVPLQLAVNAFGWRSVMAAGGLFILLVAVLIWWLVRDDPVQRGYASFAAGHREPDGHAAGILQGLARVLSNRNALLLAIVPGGIVGSLLTFSGLWGVPFLTSHYGMSPAQAAGMSTVLLVGWAIGGPLFGAFSDHVGRRKWPYVLGAWVCLLGWTAVVYLPDLPRPMLAGLLGLIGFFSGSMVLSFVFAKESMPLPLSGTVSGVVNMGVMSGPMLLQPLVGWMLDRRWLGAELDGIRVYALEAYQAGFDLMLGWLAVAAGLILLTHETHCRQVQPAPAPA